MQKTALLDHPIKIKHHQHSVASNVKVSYHFNIAKNRFSLWSHHFKVEGLKKYNITVFLCVNTKAGGFDFYIIILGAHRTGTHTFQWSPLSLFFLFLCSVFLSLPYPYIPLISFSCWISPFSLSFFFLRSISLSLFSFSPSLFLDLFSFFPIFSLSASLHSLSIFSLVLPLSLSNFLSRHFLRPSATGSDIHVCSFCNTCF